MGEGGVNFLGEYKDGCYAFANPQGLGSQAPPEEHDCHAVVLEEERVLVACEPFWAAVHRVLGLEGPEGGVQEEGPQDPEGQEGRPPAPALSAWAQWPDRGQEQVMCQDSSRLGEISDVVHKQHRGSGMKC
jgi:hypothetical protein